MVCNSIGIGGLPVYQSTAQSTSRRRCCCRRPSLSDGCLNAVSSSLSLVPLPHLFWGSMQTMLSLSGSHAQRDRSKGEGRGGTSAPVCGQIDSWELIMTHSIDKSSFLLAVSPTLPSMYISLSERYHTPQRVGHTQCQVQELIHFICKCSLNVDGSVCASVSRFVVVVVAAKFHFILFLCFDLYALKRAGISFSSSSSSPVLLAPLYSTHLIYNTSYIHI